MFFKYLFVLNGLIIFQNYSCSQDYKRKIILTFGVGRWSGIELSNDKLLYFFVFDGESRFKDTTEFSLTKSGKVKVKLISKLHKNQIRKIKFKKIKY
jgi:hypothetical protein